MTATRTTKARASHDDQRARASERQHQALMVSTCVPDRVALDAVEPASVNSSGCLISAEIVVFLTVRACRVPLLAGGLMFVVLFWRLGAPSFWDPDEAHYAETTSELIATGDWWAPYYNEQPFFDKPIFFHQLQAARDARVRRNRARRAGLFRRSPPWPSCCSPDGSATKLISAEAGFVAALLLAANPGVFGLARYAILDTLFTAFLFAGVGLVAVAALRDRPRLQWPGYLLIAGAVMVKGPLALVLMRARDGVGDRDVG